MLEEPSAIRVVVVVKEDKELLQWLERVRKEGITVVVEREGVPRVAISRVVKGRPGVVFPQIVYESTATEEEVQRALSLAGAWEDLDTEVMLHDIYEARHRPQTRPPVTFDD